MKKILVTGGAGFIGSNITEQLLHLGYNVRVLDNLSSGKQENVDLFKDHPNYEFMLGDIRNIEDCSNACRGVDAISHQAALGSVPRSINVPLDTHANNDIGFVNMLFAAKELNVKRFVFASSSSVYGDEPNLPKIENRIGNLLSPYAATKFTNEIYASVFAKVYGMETIGFRYFNIFGPRQNPNGQYAAVIPLFAKSLINNEAPFINGDGEQSRDFTYVDNAVQANILGLTTTNAEAVNQVYNIALGERFTINELYDGICKILNKDIKAIHREPRMGDIRDSLADISKAKLLLGYNPTHKFSEGLPLTIEYFKNIFQK
ncbi:MAG: SDR family oxidoreductase [Chitinophagales bacterium]|nr:SDR family oxidoreductase [Chitinophagales bacterium]MCO5247785.1 SDR family oxidoreductase [Chitinophagales bacterium]